MPRTTWDNLDERRRERVLTGTSGPERADVARRLLATLLTTAPSRLPR